MPLVSHKGAAGLAPENSKQGIVVARAYHPQYIEIDIHCTFDGIFVLYHGDVAQTYTGKRLTDTLKVLTEKQPHLLTLREMLVGHSHTAPFMFDVKCAEDIKTLVAFLQEHSLDTRHSFTSPHSTALAALKQAFPNNKTYIAQKFSKGPFRAQRIAKMRGFSGIAISKWWLNPITYLMCKIAKKEVMVYTVNNDWYMRFLQKIYPKLLICTDYPDKFPSASSQYIKP